MTNLQTKTEKLASVRLSREEAITSFRHEVMRQLRFLLIGVPLAVMTAGGVIGVVTAGNPCHTIPSCLAGEAIASTEKILSPIQVAHSPGPDSAKYPYVIAIAFVYLYAFSIILSLLYALVELAVALRMEVGQGSDVE